LVPAHIAGLVHHFAFRETPMGSGLEQKFLRILDILVDMDDRRSAALQISDSFSGGESGIEFLEVMQLTDVRPGHDRGRYICHVRQPRPVEQPGI
jgi:hypothetical protein